MRFSDEEIRNICIDDLIGIFDDDELLEIEDRQNELKKEDEEYFKDIPYTINHYYDRLYDEKRGK